MSNLIVTVLGSGAGGGFPQWNCNTRLSRLAWDGHPSVLKRTQSSIAVSSGGDEWILINASPDLRQQIGATPALWPRAEGPKRNSPIKAVVLTNGDVDHIAGLLTLRENQPFALHATGRVLDVLRQNRIFEILAPDVVTRNELPLYEKVTLPGGVAIEAFPVAGKIALYLEDRTREDFGTQLGDTIGVEVTAPGSSRLVYVPGCAVVDEALLTRVDGAGHLLFDGTLFTDTEVIDLDVLSKTSRRMGHVPISGEGGSLHAFDGIAIGKKTYIHINTTNPILEKGSPAEQTVKGAGWEVAYDGMTFTL